MTDALIGLPHLTVELGDGELPELALETLVEVRTRRELGSPAQCELTWSGPQPDAVPAIAVAPGSAMRVAAEGHEVPLFAGEVTAIEHLYGPDARHRIRVRGYDRLHRLRKRQHQRAHVHVTAVSLARDLVAELGVLVEAAWEGPRWSHLVQHQQSDFDLLVEVAARAGLFPLLEGDTLILDSLEGRGPPRSLELGAELLEARVEVNGDRSCRAITAHGWDPLHPEARSATARGAQSGRQVTASAEPASLGADDERHLLGVRAANEEQARALAQAELDDRAGREVTFSGLAAGDPELGPGRVIEVRGVDAAVCGSYVLTAATHVVDAERGFVTELSTEPPPRLPVPRSAAVALGVVTQVADPDGAGRVRARLPAFGDVESEWMRVACAGAGPGKGLVALPDVGDEVLILASHEDPTHGVVLAGLFSASGPDDAGVVGDAVRRYTLATGGGHRIVLDEENETVTVQSAGGTRLLMGPEQTVLHAATDLVVEAPGQRLLFRAALVDFERAP